MVLGLEGRGRVLNVLLVIHYIGQKQDEGGASAEEHVS